MATTAARLPQLVPRLPVEVRQLPPLLVVDEAGVEQQIAEIADGDLPRPARRDVVDGHDGQFYARYVPEGNRGEVR
jgi:hypothetical protein